MKSCERVYQGHYAVPGLGEGHVHYCENNGCEPVIVETIEEWCFRKTNGDRILREDYYTAEVCSSCGGDIGVWDTISDCEIASEYRFSEAGADDLDEVASHDQP